MCQWAGERENVGCGAWTLKFDVQQALNPFLQNGANNNMWRVGKAKQSNAVRRSNVQIQADRQENQVKEESRDKACT